MKDTGVTETITTNGSEPDIHPTVVWAKFEALAEGARIATKKLELDTGAGQ